MSTQNNLAWEKAGFEQVTDKITARLIMSLCGLEKTGKTHLAFSAPDPIAFHSLDFGDEGVSNKFVSAGKKIYKMEYKIPSARKSSEKAKEEAGVVWESFRDKYLYSLEHARTVIVDTETEAWELCRLARFGKIDKVLPHHYGPVNREYKETIIKSAYESNANVILLQRLKKEYVNDKFSGNYEQSGFSGIPFDVQVNCRCYVDARGLFCLYIDNCRQNAQIKGQTLTQAGEIIYPGIPEPIKVGEKPLNTFAELAKMVLPMTSETDWR